MSLPRLILITDDVCAKNASSDLVDLFLRACNLPNDLFPDDHDIKIMVQIRNKALLGTDLFPRYALDFVDTLTNALRLPPYFVVNGTTTLLQHPQFAGAHLPQRLISPDLISTYPHHLLGFSCHDLASLRLAARAGATYATISPLFLTRSKPGYGPPIGLSKLADFAQQLDFPIFALGGIDLENIESVVNSGCYGVAIMGALYRHDDPLTFVCKMLEALYLR